MQSHTTVSQSGDRSDGRKTARPNYGPTAYHDTPPPAARRGPVHAKTHPKTQKRTRERCVSRQKQVFEGLFRPLAEKAGEEDRTLDIYLGKVTLYR